MADISSPQISLVICTRNRAAQLSRCLRSLMQLQGTTTWELIIVDNGSSDATSQVLQSFAGQFRGSLHVLREDMPGLARARNVGWRASRAPIVAFTDDDCYPEPRFLDLISRHFEKDVALGYLGGRILLYDSADFPVTLLEYSEPIDLPGGYIIAAGTVQGANMALRRMALAQIGGFDERLGAGTPFPSEDIDVVARASALGWKGAYRPDVVVYHHHGRRTQQEVDRLLHSYDRGRGAYYAKCLMNPRIRRSALKYWVGRLPRQPWQQTGRELAAGIAFAVRHHPWRRPRPDRSAPVRG